MFAPLLAGRCRERVTALSLSLLVHAIFLGWLLHSPAPTFLTPSFLVKGENVKYIAHLYWSGKDSEIATDATSGTSFDGRNRMAKEHITWNRVKAAKSPAPRLDHSTTGTDSKTDIAGSTVHSRPAGSPYARFPMDPLLDRMFDRRCQSSLLTRESSLLIFLTACAV